MIKLQYNHPITHRIITRYFKTLYAVQQHIKMYSCPLSYYIDDDNLEEDYYGYYDPFKHAFIEEHDYE